MPQRYEIVIDPDLEIPPNSIVTAWQANDEAMAVGRIRENMTTQSAMFTDPAMTLLVTTAVSSIASVVSGVFTAVLIDYIKEKHYKKKPDKKANITTIENSDGTTIAIKNPDKKINVNHIEKPDGTVIIVLRSAE